MCSWVAEGLEKWKSKKNGIFAEIAIYKTNKMKTTLILMFLISLGTSFSQNLYRTYMDQWFPNNKHRQIERLKQQKDSLQKVANQFEANANQLEAKNEQQQHKMDSLQLAIKSLRIKYHEEKASLKDSIEGLSYGLVTCTEEMFAIAKNPNPLIKNHCAWRHYVITEIGTPDKKGWYSWKTEITKRVGDSTQIIGLSAFFKKEKISELEAMINAQLINDYQYLVRTDPKCFKRHKTFVPFKLEQMRLILLDNAEMSFEVNYNLLNQCSSLNASSAVFKIDELKVFFAD